MPTVLERLRAAGIAEHRALEHLAAGRVCVDTTVVTDPETPADIPHTVVLRTPAPYLVA